MRLYFIGWWILVSKKIPLQKTGYLLEKRQKKRETEVSLFKKLAA